MALHPLLQAGDISWKKDCGDPCSNLQTVGLPGCRVVSINVVTRSYGEEVSWYILQACPSVEVAAGTMASDSEYTTAVCLVPADYTFVAQDSQGDGWEGGSFSVTLDGVLLVPPTQVDGWGSEVAFAVPAALRQYVVRLARLPDPARAPLRVRDIRAYDGDGAEMLLSPNFNATDTGLDALYWSTRDHATVRTLKVWPAGGTAVPLSSTSLAIEYENRLLKTFRFSAARPVHVLQIPVDCGPLTHPSVDVVGDCEHAFGGVCAVACPPGYTGDVVVACGRNGSWAVSGACAPAGTAYAAGSARYGESGAGVAADLPVPVPFAPPGLPPVDAVVLGHSHSAVRAAGQWYGLGRGAEGQLGLPRREAASDPVPLLSPNEQPIDAVVLGWQHTAFLAGGQCYAFGANTYGELGLGHQVCQA